VCCSVLQRVAVSSVLQCLSTGSATSLVSTTFLEVASVVQCVAVCCSVLQRVAVCCSVLQCLSTGSAASLVPALLVCCGVFLGSTTSLVSTTFLEVASVLQCVAVCCSVLQCVAMSFY